MKTTKTTKATTPFEEYQKALASGKVERIPTHIADKLKVIATERGQTERDNIISADTLENKATAITIRALLTTYVASGNKTIRAMLFDAIDHAHEHENGGNGADLVQDTALYLWGYAGKSLEDTTEDGQTDRDGNPITILRGAFRNIHRKIYKLRAMQLKSVYITDYENKYGEIKVPFEWDVDSYEDLTALNTIIKSLNLTANQYQVLNLRLRGMSYEDCARNKGCSKQNISKVLNQIRTKYTALYGAPSEVALKYIFK